MNNQYLFADHIADGIYNIECEISSLFVDVVAVAYYRNLMAFRRLFFMWCGVMCRFAMNLLRIYFF